MLHDINVSGLRGLEIGPLVNPLVSKSQGDVYYIDRADTATLKDWYANDPSIDVDAICDVDFIWGQKTLPESINGQHDFDYCVAAHVLEHIPDLIGWLKEIAAVLREGGIAVFAVPDKRYTFDCLRPLTTVADLVDAHLKKLRRPEPKHIFDHFSSYTDIDIQQAWTPGFDCTRLKPRYDERMAWVASLDAIENDKYVDAHCSVFTSESFISSLKVLSKLGLFDFAFRRFFDVEPFHFEFVVQIEKLPSSYSVEEKYESFCTSLRQMRPHRIEIRFTCTVPGEAQIYYDTGNGFNELESRTLSFSNTEKPQRLVFEIPSARLKQLRFDPVKAPARFSISAINVSPFGESRLDVPIANVKPLINIRESSFEDGEFWASSEHGTQDPAVAIELPEQITSRS